MKRIKNIIFLAGVVLLSGNVHAVDDNSIKGDTTVWVTGTNKVPGGYGVSYGFGKTGSNLSNVSWTATNIWEGQPIGAMAISTDAGGNPWIINSVGDIFTTQNDGLTDTVADKRTRAIITSITNNEWLHIPGKAKDIGTGGGKLWIIGAKEGIYSRENNVWIRKAGAAVRIDVDGAGQPWVVNRTGSIFHISPKTGQFVQISGQAKDIGVGNVSPTGDDVVWVIGMDNGIYKLEGHDHWVRYPGSINAIRIDVDRYGNPWVVNNAGAIYMLLSDKWIQVRGSATDIGVQ